MEITEAIEILKYYNRWRRGEDIKQPNPEMIGVAIDVVLKHLDHGLKYSSTII